MVFTGKPKITNLCRHAQSREHRMAVAELLKIPDEVLEHAAPSVAEFTAVYKSIKKGSAIRHGTDFGSHKKMDKITI